MSIVKYGQVYHIIICPCYVVNNNESKMILAFSWPELEFVQKYSSRMLLHL
jgi:hypothetical protein